MKANKIHGPKKTIQRLIRLCKQAAQEGAYRVARRRTGYGRTVRHSM